MFPIDKSLLPSLPTRRALLVLDLQNDFLQRSGALPVSEPSDFAYVKRIVDLAASLRGLGSGSNKVPVDIIWVRSEHERDRRITNEQILTSDALGLARVQPRGRTRDAAPPVGSLLERDEEAFLSGGGKVSKDIVKPGTSGAELADVVAKAVKKEDYLMTKTHYSAFHSGQLVQRLRQRFVTELYICGALTNVSIYATALDAGMHGYGTTLVEDCCGYRMEARHLRAVRKLLELTDCEIATAAEVLDTLRPGDQLRSMSRSSGRSGRSAKSNRSDGGKRRSGGAIMAGAEGKRSRPPSVTQGIERRDSHPMPDMPTDAGKMSAGPASATVSRRNSEQPLGIAPPPREVQPMGGTFLKDHSESESDSDEQVDDAHRVTLPLRPAKPDAGQANGGGSVGANDSPDAVRDAFRNRSKPDDAKTHQQEEPISDDQATSEDIINAFPAISSSSKTSSVSKEITNQSKTASNESHVEDTMAELGSPEANKSPAALATDKVGPSQPGTEPLDDPALDIGANSNTTQISEPLCEGDTTIIRNALPSDLAARAFDSLKAEVAWQRMSHQGGEVPRLVAVQGAVEADGTMPVYRHPSDESPPLLPFTPTVDAIREEVQKLLGHELNHVLIQLYRSGNDYISEHSDKTIDIVPGSFIANVSLGAERTMVFRTKRADKDPSRQKTTTKDGTTMTIESPAITDSHEGAPPRPATPESSEKRRSERATLPHNSLCRMGLRTNERWLHAIRQDKRSDREKTDSELGKGFGGARISLTFRHIGTFLSPAPTISKADAKVDGSEEQGLVIWGQGATSKARATAKPVINGQTLEAVRMLQAFGTENHSSDFDWAEHYGQGSDVLHMNAAPRFFAGPDAIANARVGIMLAECGVLAAKGNLGLPAAKAGVASDDSDMDVLRRIPIALVDNDADRSKVEGELAILLYLDAAYGIARTARAMEKPSLAKLYTRLQQAMEFGELWRAEVRKISHLPTDVVQQIAETGAGGEQQVTLSPRVRSALDDWEAIFAKLQTADGKQGTDQAESNGATEQADSAVEIADQQLAPSSVEQQVPKFLAGRAAPSLVDVAVWPVLHDMRKACGEHCLDEYKHLTRFFASFAERPSAKQARAR